MRRFARAITLAAACLLSGCAGFVVDLMADAPNKGKPPDKELRSRKTTLNVLGVDRELFVPIDDPPATIRAWVIEPPEAGDGSGPRGTVLVLHGIKVPSWIMRVKGSDLSGAGYRVVMVDLRGHGGSTGEHHTFGLAESRDLVRVIDALDREGLIAGRLGVWGVSLGAATAIHLASLDDRVEAVVAVTPFTTMREAATSFIRHRIPFDRRWSDDELNAMIDRAAEQAGFRADEADTRPAMRQLRIPVLIIAGEKDRTTPVGQAIELWELAPPGSSLIVRGGLGHFGVGLDLGWHVKRASIDWFDRHLAGTEEPGPEGRR